jgi:hypothetical protein
MGPGLTLMTTLHAFASDEYSLVIGTANRVIGKGAPNTPVLSTVFFGRPQPGHHWTTW